MLCKQCFHDRSLICAASNIVCESPLSEWFFSSVIRAKGMQACVSVGR